MTKEQIGDYFKAHKFPFGISKMRVAQIGNKYRVSVVSTSVKASEISVSFLELVYPLLAGQLHSVPVYTNEVAYTATAATDLVTYGLNVSLVIEISL